MRIALCYVVVTHGTRTADFVARFASSYHDFPPGIFHDTFVLCNGGPLRIELGLLFLPLQAKFYPRVNDGGWDIAAFIEAANDPCADYDMLLCLGESVYFKRAGWLQRLVEAWEKHGPGLYGVFGSFSVRAHLQTTAFACAPAMLRQWPAKVRDRADRYEFEHGTTAFWRVLHAQGYPVLLVTWDGEWEPRDWRKPKNSLWSGDQSNLLMQSNHCDNWEKADPARKARWSRSANQAFK